MLDALHLQVCRHRGLWCVGHPRDLLDSLCKSALRLHGAPEGGYRRSQAVAGVG